MRILHLVHQYIPEYVGGTELYTQTLARYQVSRQGHRAAIFYPSEQEPHDGSVISASDECGVHVHAAPVGPRSRAQVFLDSFGQRTIATSLQRVLDAEQPDVVHVQHLMGLPLSLLTQLKAMRIPIVITLHDYWFPCANGQLLTNYDNQVCDGPRWWLNCARCALARAGVGDRRWLTPAVAPLFAYRSSRLRRWLAQADRVIAPTHFVRDTYDRLNMPTENVVVVPHGIEVPAHVLEAEAATLPHQPGRLHIVYVGSLAWQKGLHVLVEAVNHLPPEAVRLTIYGDLDNFPDYVHSLQAQVEHPGITFPGRITRDDFWPMLLQEVDVAVLPTLWYEASPLTIQEMFAARVPLVASNIGALPEKIRHGVDGVLFPPGDAAALRDVLQRLLDTPQQLRRLQANIRPTRLMDEHVEDVQAIYEALLQP
ncbi:MAG TPA: glycosyltransferase family 4 protein [Candidatus Sulfomarinibacteraceae bacterium]|nr:glycosyltransferase family 4 protein [Candidatus Sulfomarinibacteraceae bacterium]